MNTRTIVVAAALLALVAGLAVSVVACSADAPDCSRGTLRLEVQLNLTASYADQIVVQSYAPPFMQTFTHTPSGMPGELVKVDVNAFPEGYPTDKLLTLLVRAYGQNQLIGESLAQIHTQPVCTVGGVTIAPHTIDAAPMPDGMTDGGAHD